MRVNQAAEAPSYAQLISYLYTWTSLLLHPVFRWHGRMRGSGCMLLVDFLVRSTGESVTEEASQRSHDGIKR